MIFDDLCIAHNLRVAHNPQPVPAKNPNPQPRVQVVVGQGMGHTGPTRGLPVLIPSWPSLAHVDLRGGMVVVVVMIYHLYHKL